MSVVPGAGGGIGGNRGLDRGQVVGRKVDCERAERLGEPVAAARIDERHDVGAPSGYPGEGDLRDGGTFRAGDLA